MKTLLAFSFSIFLSGVALAQQSGSSSDCPLSHWSSTGAACFYAPDLPPTVDASYKAGLRGQSLIVQNGNLLWNDSLNGIVTHPDRDWWLTSPDMLKIRPTLPHPLPGSINHVSDSIRNAHAR